MEIAVVCKTLRTHDNPFLEAKKYIIFVPTGKYNTKQTAWIDKHILPNHTKVLASFRQSKGLPKPEIVRSASKLPKTKVCTDCQWFLRRCAPKVKVHEELPAWNLVNNWSTKTEPLLRAAFDFRQKQKVFEYVDKNIRRLFPDEISKKQTNLELHPLHETSFMKSQSWQKPKTFRKATWGSRKKGARGTSQLSPYFAVGAISPVRAFRFWRSGSATPLAVSSASGQLVWREMFHACARFPWFWKPNPSGRKQKFRSSGKYKNDQQVLQLAKDYPDTHWAIRQLYSTGWIHHLARHLLADFWCGPNTASGRRLGWAWQDGVRWFEDHLLDHDPAVNRANWMWLAGVAFSSKQRSSVWHYGLSRYLSGGESSSEVVLQSTQNDVGIEQNIKNYSLLKTFIKQYHAQDRQMRTTFNEHLLKKTPLTSEVALDILRGGREKTEQEKKKELIKQVTISRKQDTYNKIFAKDHRLKSQGIQTDSKVEAVTVPLEFYKNTIYIWDPYNRKTYAQIDKMVEDTLNALPDTLGLTSSEYAHVDAVTLRTTSETGWLGLYLNVCIGLWYRVFSDKDGFFHSKKRTYKVKSKYYKNIIDASSNASFYRKKNAVYVNVDTNCIPPRRELPILNILPIQRIIQTTIHRMTSSKYVRVTKVTRELKEDFEYEDE